MEHSLREVLFDEDALRTSTSTIDDLIDEEGMKNIILGMRCEIAQNVRETARSPSDLVTPLMEHYDNPEIVYARFIYAFQILGHRLYGHRAIRKMECVRRAQGDIQFDIDNYGTVDEREFLLHQFLAIACRVIPSDCRESFIAYCANEMGHNRNNYNMPCEVLTRLLMENKITTENHVELMEDAMIKAGVPETVLQEYQEICDKIETNSFQVRSRTSTRTSDGLHRIRRNVISSMRIQAAAQEVGGGREEQLDNSDNKKHYFSIACTVICLLLGVILIILLALLVSHSIEERKRNKLVTLRGQENTTAILTDVNHFQTASLTVTEDTRYVGDFQHPVDVYQLASPCNSIPSLTETYAITDGTNFYAINGTKFYALSGSTVSFNICGSTNATAPDIERLEVVVQKDSQPVIIDFLYLGTNDEWQCKDSVLSLEEPGYYTINFLLPTHEARFRFNTTYNVRKIDTEQLQERATSSYTLYTDQDRREFPLKFGAIHSCFVGAIGDNPSSPKTNVHIQLNFKRQSGGYAIEGVLITVLSLAIIVTVVVYITFRARRLRN